MSLTSSRHLPDRPSLEQLRKQAREHLDTLRAADPSVKLAAAQHALARAYGFESWPRLVQHVDSLQPASRMLRPAALRSDDKLLWSTGRGSDVWALIQACISGDLEAVRALIERDPSLARAHYTYRKPLYFAVRENRIDVARFLLEHDRNPMDLWFDDSPLDIARDRGYVEMERLLTETLDTEFNASMKGEPIALALREHDLARMRALLDANPALLSKGDLRSNQPIHWATMTRQLEAIDELLQRGADIEARRMDGAQPIHLTNGDYFYRGWRDVPRDGPTSACAGDGAPAVTRRHRRSADRVSHRRSRTRAGAAPTGSVAGQPARWLRGLLCRRRRPGRQRRGSRSARHRAAGPRVRRRSQPSPGTDRAARQGVVRGGHQRPLRDREAAARARCVRDEHIRSTPLAWAAKFGQREMVTLLLERGAPSSLPDDPVWATPLAWAKKRGHEDIARLLQR